MTLARSRAGRAAAWGLGAVALALLTWHVPSIATGVSLDDSAHIALHLAASQGLDFGRDIVFTSGPLGFLTAPLLVGPATALGSFGYAVVAQVLLALLVLRASWRTYGPVGGALLAFVALSVPLLLPDFAVYISFFLCVWLLEREEAPPWWWLSVLGGALAGFQLLVKLNGGIFCFALFALAVWRLPPRGWRSEGILFGSFAVTVPLLWLATGNPIGNLPDSLRHSWQVVSAYTDAMALEVDSRRLEYVTASLLLLAAAALLAWHLRTRRARWPLLLLAAAIYTFPYLKEGFVRHDAHDLHFFSALAVGMLAFWWQGWARWAAAAVVVGAVGAILLTPEYSLTSLYRPFSNPNDAITQTRDVLDAGRRERLIEDGKERARAELAVPAAQLALLRGHTVDTPPLNTSAVWAYDLRWKPEPLIQWYMAYDSTLDRLNAEALSERGAERVLRSRCCVVDGKLPDFEAPATYLALLCHYRELAADERWEVLARTENRCGEPRELATVHANSGDVIPIPAAPSPDEIVVARIEFPKPILGRVASLLFKPLRLPRVTLNGTADYRFIPATGAGPLVLSLPASTGISPLFDGGRVFTTMQLRRVPSPFTVVFEAVPIRPS